MYTRSLNLGRKTSQRIFLKWESSIFGACCPRKCNRRPVKREFLETCPPNLSHPESGLPHQHLHVQNENDLTAWSKATPNSDTEALLEAADSLLSAETMLAMGVVFWRSPALFATCFCLLFNAFVIVCAPSPNMFVTAFVILPLSVRVPLLAQTDMPFFVGKSRQLNEHRLCGCCSCEAHISDAKRKGLGWQAHVFILNAYTGLTEAN